MAMQDVQTYQGFLMRAFEEAGPRTSTTQSGQVLVQQLAVQIT
jgi:hypothetical protein